MSRRSFDDGHQNQAHTSGFNLDFDVMHNLFHGGREGAENAVRGLVDAAQIAETGHTQDEDELDRGISAAPGSQPRGAR